MLRHIWGICIVSLHTRLYHPPVEIQYAPYHVQLIPMGFRLLVVQLFEHLMLFIICFVQAFELFVFCHVTPYVVVGRAVVQVISSPLLREPVERIG